MHCCGVGRQLRFHHLVSVVFVVTILLCLGCHTGSVSSGKEEMKAEDLAPEPSNVITLNSSPVEVHYGEEAEFCEILEIPTDFAFWMVRFEVDAGPGTHHLLVLSVTAEEQETTDCKLTEPKPGMELLIGTESSTEDIVFPEGVGLRFEARQHIMIDHHVTNFSETTQLYQSHYRLTYQPEDAPMIPASVMLINQRQINIPASTTDYQHSVTCPLPWEMSLGYFVPHFHELGNQIQMELLDKTSRRDRNLTQVSLFRMDYGNYENLSRTDDPAVAERWDSLRLTCSWSNPEQQSIEYPDEMCMVGILVWPATKSLYCDENGIVYGSLGLPNVANDSLQ